MEHIIFVLSFIKQLKLKWIGTKRLQGVSKMIRAQEGCGTDHLKGLYFLPGSASELEWKFSEDNQHFFGIHAWCHLMVRYWFQLAPAAEVSIFHFVLWKFFWYMSILIWAECKLELTKPLLWMTLLYSRHANAWQWSIELCSKHKLKTARHFFI